MANDFEVLLPNILGAALIKLRKSCKLLGIVRRDFANEVSEPGETINFKGRTAFSTNAVTPGSVTIQEITTAGRSMSLNLHREVSFALTDAEVAALQRNKGMVLTDAIEDAVEALANYIAAQVYANYVGFYTMTGVIGTVPDAVSDITDIKRAARNLKWPDSNRHIVWDAASEAKLLQLALLTEQAATGDDAIRTGNLGYRFGFRHWADHPVDDLVHTKGAEDGNYVVNGVNALGSKSLVVKTGANDIHKGDILTIAGDSQEYVVTALYAGGAGTLAIEPGLKIATSGDEAITVKATQSHFSLALHRDAIGLAIRPLPMGISPGKLQSVVSDPDSALSLRLTVEGQHAQDVMTLDILGGTAVLDPALGIRVQSGA